MGGGTSSPSLNDYNSVVSRSTFNPPKRDKYKPEEKSKSKKYLLKMISYQLFRKKYRQLSSKEKAFVDKYFRSL